MKKSFATAIAIIIFMMVILFLAALTASIYGLFDREAKDPIYNDAPMVHRSNEDKKVFQDLRHGEDNPLVVLQYHWGGNLKDKIRGDFKSRGKILSESAEITLLQKANDGDLQLEVSGGGAIEGKVLKGEIFVKISGDTDENNGIYSLYCLNGMISDRKVNEEYSFRIVGTVVNQPKYIVPKGRGLMDVMTLEEAVETAFANNILITKSGKAGRLIAHVRPGDCFEKVYGQIAWKRCNQWKELVVRYKFYFCCDIVLFIDIVTLKNKYSSTQPLIAMMRGFFI